jgi:hypothetical protein
VQHKTNPNLQDRVSVAASFSAEFLDGEDGHSHTIYDKNYLLTHIYIGIASQFLPKLMTDRMYDWVENGSFGGGLVASTVSCSTP